MVFGFNEEQQLWYKTVHDFMDKEITREYVRKCDEDRRYPYEAYEKVAKQGWLGLLIPEEYGGEGLDAIMYAIFCEAVGKYSSDFGTVFYVPTFTAMNIVKHGTNNQKREYLPRFINGEIPFSISITEPNAGSDAANVQTKAVLDGDYYKINGQKVFSSGAHVKNNIMVMLTRTDPNLPKHKGLTVFLVPNDLPGIEMRLLPTLARRVTGTNEVFLTDVCVPQSNMLGNLNEGWKVITEHLEIERLAITAGYVGNAQTAVDDAVRYAKEREQFGQPISKFQVIRHMLAQMQTEVDAARLLLYRAASMISRGIPCMKEVAMAKLFASETLLKVATDGMQILGGYAQLSEYDMERYWREGKQAMVGGGTSQIQRSVIAKQMGL